MISLRRLRRQYIPTQCVAAFWLAFYTIAALRSVIPGACETQACVLERAEAAQAASEAHACCSAIKDGTPVATVPHTPHEPHCAMCSLMTAASDTESVAHAPAVEPAPNRPPRKPDTLYATSIQLSTGPRAPPSSSFVS